MTNGHMSRKKMTNGQKKYPYIDLGNKLKELRGGLNQEDYAKQLGVALRTYHRYEKGERKIPDGLLKLATLLNRNNTKITYVSEPEDEYKSQQQELINMTRFILESQTESAIALAANIRAFYNNLKKQVEFERRLAHLEDQLLKVNSDLVNHVEDCVKR